MAQFDVYRNSNSATQEDVPFLLDVQNDLLETLSTRVVVPLVKASVMSRPAAHLNPEFEIEGVRVVMSTAELAGIHHQILRTKVTSLAKHRPEIVAAIDFLVTGI